jgi:DNA-binding response OmpR family regulator
MVVSANVLVADRLAGCDERLDEERARALEAIAQKLRQPLIDQLNWCELLMTDSARSLPREHVELVARISSTAGDLLAQVQDLLDEEKLLERAKISVRSDGDGPEGAAHAARSPQATEAGTGPELADAPSTPAAQLDTTGSPSWAVESLVPQRSDAKVLVVEGSSTLRDLLVSVLRPTFHVSSAADGWEALERMVDRPDVIVTELDLPIVGVADLLGHARRIAGGVAVLALCDATDAALLATARSLGIRDVLLKPFRIPAVVEKVAALAAARGTPPNKSVLVVCPDPRQAYTLYHLLDARYRTQIAPSTEAARGAAGSPFDLLIVDAAAGDSGWQDAIALMRESRPDILVLALVDNDEGTDGALGQLGVDSTVLKPYSCDDLLQRVRALLGIGEIDGSILRSVFRRVAL